MGEMKSIGLRFAKATEEDFRMCEILFGILNDIDNDSFPRDVDGEFKDTDPDWIDPDDGDQCKLVVSRILTLMRRCPSGLNRVHALAHIADSNGFFDPAQDHLAWHPDLVPAIEAREARKKAAAIEKEGASHGS